MKKENCEYYLPDIKGMTEDVMYVKGACKRSMFSLWGQKTYLVCDEKKCPISGETADKVKKDA